MRPDSAPTSSRPDASMTLLREVMERPLDPSYAAAARHPRQRGVRDGIVTTALAVLAALVTVVAVGQLSGRAPEASRTAQRLREEITARTEAADARRAANERLQAQIAAAQAAALGSGPGVALAEQVRRLELAAGETPVTGPGIEYRLSDAPATGVVADGQNPRTGDTADGRVLDRDLQIVVNGLWAAGAEAIAVNGVRLTALSAIRSAGDAILVDYRPLVPPYVVAAIGNPSALQADFAAGMGGPYVQSLQNNYGVQVTVTARKGITLPGSGPLLLRIARPAQPLATPRG